MNEEENITAQDFLGYDLVRGDEVATMLVGYRQFRRALVIKLTEKTCKLLVIGVSKSFETKQFPEQVCKIIQDEKRTFRTREDALAFIADYFKGHNTGIKQYFAVDHLKTFPWR